MTENKYKYLNLIKRPLDDDQSAVCFNTKNAVIAAGAGSGKTQVLATRFAWLVMSKKLDVSQILTLTFTDKAASEMYKRIYDTLAFFANYQKGQNPKAKPEDEEDLTEEKIQLAKKALESFSNSHIQTLDSYCGSIVRQCANRYGLTPDFSVGSADSARNIKNEAFKFVLQHKDSKAVQTFAKAGALQSFAEDTLADTIIKNTSIATPEGWFMKKLERQKNEIVTVWNYLALNKGKVPGFESIQKIAEEALNTLETCGKADDKKKAAWVQAFRDFIDVCFNLSDLEPIQVEDFESSEGKKIIEANLVPVNAFEAVYEKYKAAKESISDVKKVTAKIEKHALKFIHLCNAFIEQYEAIKSLNLLFEEFMAQVNSSKRCSGSLSFSDVTSLALKVLIENEDIRNQEKNAYHKIMIDEFQDNNGKNRDLLYLLSLKKGEFESENPKDNFVIEIDEDDPDSLHNKIILKDEQNNIIEDKRDSEKLFFVGDEKQSIYKFRGADVTVFNELTDADEKKSENGLLSMTYNYRSEPALVKSFNLLFKNGNGIFNAPSTETLYEANYAKEARKNGIELPELTKENVPVHFCFSSDKKILQNEGLPVSMRKSYIPQKEQNAYFVAKKIYELAEKENFDWSRFAILDKSRTDRRLITKYLGMFKIPFVVDQFSNIFEDAVVNDFYNFLRICVYPSDINAFAAYLSSPFAGLTENQVEIVLSHLVDIKKRSPEDEQFVFDPFNDITEILKAELDSQAVEKYVQAMEYFKQNKNLVLRSKLTDTLSTLWNNRGYKYETMLSDEANLCAEHFDMLFELARTADENEKNVAWFIDELQNLKTEDDSDVDAKSVSYPLERQSAVQIMTIHKSKGLQFDHVFVWGCTNVRAKGHKSLVFFEEDNGISVKADGSASNYFYEKQKSLSAKKELAEFRRLIYVAITRAVKDVYVLGEWSYSEKERKIKEPAEFDSNGEPGKKLLERMAYFAYPELAEPQTEDYALKGVFNGAPETGFDYFSIPEVEYDELVSQKTESSDSLRNKVISSSSLQIQDDEITITESHPIPKAAPSHLEQPAGNEVGELFASQNQFEGKKDLYDELTELLKKYSPSTLGKTEEEINNPDDDTLTSGIFTAADYGTLVHDYLNKMCLGIEPEEYEPDAKLLKNLKNEDVSKLKAFCIKMCRSFAENELYKKFCEAKKDGRFAESELEFKYYDGKTLYHGSIDLIFEESDGSFVIVDYKTDQAIQPEKHYLQQKCYRTASRDITGCNENIKNVLYYLRFEETVDITQQMH